MFVNRAFGDDTGPYIVYTVKSGDTLDAIAKRYGTTYQAIAATNELDDPNAIDVGQELMIYTNVTAPIAVAASLKPTVIRVPTVSKQAIPVQAKAASPSILGMDPATINYILIGGTIALSIPIILHFIKQRQQAA